MYFEHRFSSKRGYILANRTEILSTFCLTETQ